MHVSTVVIGLGMIGAAALRALSESSDRGSLLGIGPAEPDDPATFAGPFASHFDQGRITRVSDPDLIWATLADRSIAAYDDLEQRSAVAFHHPIGHLRLGSHDERLDAAEAHARMLGAPVERLGHAALVQRFPEVQFPPDAEAIVEDGGAGWINPRALVQAQLTIAEQHGAAIIRDAVTGLQRENGLFLVETQAGRRIYAERMVLSADASSIALLEQLLGRRVVLTTQAYTVVYAAIAPAQLEQFTATPTLIWPLSEHPFLSSIYTTSATAFPDGRSYLKIGGVPHAPIFLASPDDWRAWFHGPGRAEEIAALQEVLQAIYPQLVVQSWAAKTCANSYTAHGAPYIAKVADHLVLCTGGCGAAAKSSDAIGRLGAQLLLRGNWIDELPAETFQAVWA
ncbi:MAG: FAD-binding oxidoreductase [Oscillochloris sp.]|nr:FAD-binding oxidoreductase [Oscillochloris sp.]